MNFKLSQMFTIPNFLSILRIPLAFLFLKQEITWRLTALILAMLTDFLDGYLARRNQWQSRLGTLLDPLTDKFFVFMVLFTLIDENRLSFWEAGAMLCRDLSVIVFGVYLALRGYLARYQFRAIWCGKVTTTLQFLVLLALTLGYEVSVMIYGSFIFLGILALAELYLSPHEIKPTTTTTTTI